MTFDPNQPRNKDGEWTLAGNAARQAASFTNSQAAGRALGDRIVIDRLQYAAMNSQARKQLLSHELAHNVVEDLIYKTPEEWNKATEALLLKTTERGNSIYFEFMNGQMKFGEAIATAISVYINDDSDPMDVWNPLYGDKPWDKNRWTGMMDWAKHALSLSGYNKKSFNAEVERLKQQLDREL